MSDLVLDQVSKRYAIVELYVHSVVADHLLPGICHVTGGIVHWDQRSSRTIDWRHRCVTLRVDPGKPVRGAFDTPHRWWIDRASRRLTRPPMEYRPFANCSPDGERSLADDSRTGSAGARR
jgi:hypothetical protein